MTSFVLKILAALSMLVDHTGLILFPKLTVLRIIGRLAFPIYAFCIAEGFIHTKNRLKYFLRIFILGAVCQIVYTAFTGEFYFGVLITFSLSMILMWSYDDMRNELTGDGTEGKKSLTGKPWAAVLIFVTVLAGMYVLTRFVKVDYGFFGILLPFSAIIFKKKPWRLASFLLCLLFLCFWRLVRGNSLGIQYWSLLAMIPIILYNGNRGPKKFKYFFYVFYPLHLVVLYGIRMLIRGA